MQGVEEVTNTSFQRDLSEASFTTPYELTDLRSRRFRSKMRMAEQASHHSSNSNNASVAEDNVNNLVDQWDRQRSRSRAAHSESVNIGRRNSIESAKPLAYEIKTFKEIKREARSRFYPVGMSVRSNSQESLGLLRDVANAPYEDTTIQEEECEGRDTYNGQSDAIVQNIITEENQDNVLVSTNGEAGDGVEEKKELSKVNETAEHKQKTVLKGEIGKSGLEAAQASGNRAVQGNTAQLKRKSKVGDQIAENLGASLKRDTGNTKTATAKTVKRNILNNLAQSSLEESTKGRDKLQSAGSKRELRQERAKPAETLKAKKEVPYKRSGLASKALLTEPAQDSNDSRLGRPKTANSKLSSTSTLANELAKEKNMRTLTLNSSFHDQEELTNTSFDQANGILTPGAGTSSNFISSRDKSEDLGPSLSQRARNEISRTMTPSKRPKSQFDYMNSLAYKSAKPKINKKFEDMEKETNLFAIKEAKKKVKKPDQTENPPQITTQKQPLRTANTKLAVASSTKTLPKKEQDSKKSATLSNKQPNSSNYAQSRPASAKDPKAISKSKPLVSKPKPLQIDSQQGSATNSAITSPRTSVTKNETIKPLNEDQTSQHTASLMQKVQKQIKEDAPSNKVSELESIPEKVPKKQKHKITEDMTKAFDY